ncbi:hypothetical protein J6590_058425 [Homalodisca vitripennis]|nr:hypothetical protein J6590_058425 [Homalodisca vitripennis]
MLIREHVWRVFVQTMPDDIITPIVIKVRFSVQQSSNSRLYYLLPHTSYRFCSPGQLIFTPRLAAGLKTRVAPCVLTRGSGVNYNFRPIPVVNLPITIVSQIKKPAFCSNGEFEESNHWNEATITSLAASQAVTRLPKTLQTTLGSVLCRSSVQPQADSTTCAKPSDHATTADSLS